VVVDGLQRVRGGLTVEPHRIDMPHVFEAPNAIPGEVIKTTPASPSNSDKR
jgi:hypothetical protein